MVTVVVIFSVAYLLIASGNIPPVLVAVLGAIAMVVLGVISEQQALSYVNLEVILLLAAMMSLAEMAGRTGVFEWAAIRSAQLAGGRGFRTLCLMAGFTAVASALLDNVTVVVLTIPVTLSVCRTLNVSPVPFLFAQVFASNIGGVSTVIADPPNIIIAAAGDIGFVDFVLNVAPVGVISTGVLFIVLYVWFRKQVVTTAASREAVMRQNAGDEIKDRVLLIKVCVVLAFTLVGFLIHDALNVEPVFVALAGATILVLISRLDPQDVVQHVEWTTLAFFAGLFMLVGGLVETGVTLEIRDWMVDASGDSEPESGLPAGVVRRLCLGHSGQRAVHRHDGGGGAGGVPRLRRPLSALVGADTRRRPRGQCDHRRGVGQRRRRQPRADQRRPHQLHAVLQVRRGHQRRHPSNLYGLPVAAVLLVTAEDGSHGHRRACCRRVRRQ